MPDIHMESLQLGNSDFASRNWVSLLIQYSVIWMTKVNGSWRLAQDRLKEKYFFYFYVLPDGHLFTDILRFLFYSFQRSVAPLKLFLLISAAALTTEKMVLPHQ